MTKAGGSGQMHLARLKSLAPTAMLVGVTAIWGWTFLIVKDAVASYPVPAFLALRFVLATVLLAPFAWRGLSKKSIGIGLLIGMPVGAGYLFQTAGLTTTGAVDAGLLTGLFVILTPILDRLIYRAPLAKVTVGSALTGLVGTGLLTLQSSHGVGLGDILEVLTALAFAVQIVWLGRYSSGQPSMPMALGQVAPVAMVCMVLTAVTEGSGFRWPDAQVWLAILITGGLASALAFWVQTFVQQRIPPSRTAIILLGEPAFATAFAVWLGGERLNAAQWAGAALILLSLLAHEAWMATRGGMVAQGVLG